MRTVLKKTFPALISLKLLGEKAQNAVFYAKIYNIANSGGEYTVWLNSEG